LKLAVSNLIGKAVAFRDKHKFSAPTVFVGLGLLVFPLWGAFTGWPSVTAIFGYSFIFVACAYSLYYFKKQLRIGSLWLFVPLLILLFLALLRLAVGSEPIGDRVLLSSYLLLMIVFYFTAKQKGESLLWFVIPAIVIYSINVIADGILHFGSRARGLSTNPDTLAAMLMFCIFMLRGRWVWLVPLGLAAIMWTGSYWAFSGLVVGGIVYLISKRKEFRWNSRFARMLIVCLVLFCVFIGAGFATGMAERLLSLERITIVTQDVNSPADLIRNIDTATYGRLTFYKYAFVDHFSWLGNGLNNVDNSPFVEGIGRMLIHNVPSMVMFELGPLALLAWLVTIGYGIWKSKKYRYVLIAILTLSVFGGSEFYTWYTFGSYYFLTLGLVGCEMQSGV